MLTVETARAVEIRNSFQEASLLVLVAMRLVLKENVERMLGWGDDPRWVDMMLGKIGVNSQVATDEVMEMVKAGKRSVWGMNGKNGFEAMVGRVIKKSGHAREIESRRILMVELALKATVMAMVGGENDEYINQMNILKLVQQEPEFLDELFGQLRMNISDGRRGGLVELLRKVDLD